MDPLDNWVWRALTGPHAHLSEGSGEARRYQPAVSVFAGLPDVVTPGSWADLAALVPPDQAVVVFRDVVGPLPEGWSELMRLPGLQMIGPPPDRTRPSLPDVEVITLGPDDVDAMSALVELTQPGPFEARTIEMGTYLGVRNDGELVAMAGQRMRLEGYTEISAVCTHPEHQGHGLAGLLVERLVDEIHGRDEVPFLHAASHNATAISRYRSLGFTTRREVEAVAVMPAAAS